MRFVTPPLLDAAKDMSSHAVLGDLPQQGRVVVADPDAVDRHLAEQVHAADVVP